MGMSQEEEGTTEEVEEARGGWLEDEGGGWEVEDRKTEDGSAGQLRGIEGREISENTGEMGVVAEEIRKTNTQIRKK